MARIAAEIASPGVEIREEGAAAVRYRMFLPGLTARDVEGRVRDLWREWTGRPARSRSFEEPDADCSAAARAGFTGARAGAFWIGPPWIDPPAGCLAIRINPGRAFGTGLHPTTRLALGVLARRGAPPARVLDVGTGSGVLALAAAALGARRVTALEHDLHALGNARENVALNVFGRAVRLVAGTPDALASGRAAFDLVLVNVELPLLIPLLPRLVAALAPDGRLVASGVTLEQREAFVASAAAWGTRVRHEIAEEGWWGAELAAH